MTAETDGRRVNSGSGIFFDGVTSARRDVTVRLADAGLEIAATDGTQVAAWPYGEIEGLPAPENVLRLGRRGDTVLARLEILDPVFAGAIDELAGNVDRTGSLQRRQRASAIGWTLAATVSLLLVAFFGVPAIAERLTPLVPVKLERRLGNAVDAQLRGMLDTKNAGDKFECRNNAGRAALDVLIGKLEKAAALPVPLRVSVVRRDQANAIALPGGRVYVFEGLIDKADNPDEVAGVIAHEIGHVAHRDGTRSVLQGAGLSFLFGMLLGDFVGGGAVVVAARTALQSSYSRKVEGMADAYGARLLTTAGGDARALGTMLGKIGGATEPGMTILLDHPETKSRIAAINAIAPAHKTAPMLDAASWAALKRICAG